MHSDTYITSTLKATLSFSRQIDVPRMFNIATGKLATIPKKKHVYAWPTGGVLLVASPGVHEDSVL